MLLLFYFLDWLLRFFCIYKWLNIEPLHVLNRKGALGPVREWKLKDSIAVHKLLGAVLNDDAAQSSKYFTVLASSCRVNMAKYLLEQIWSIGCLGAPKIMYTWLEFPTSYIVEKNGSFNICHFFEAQNRREKKTRNL